MSRLVARALVPVAVVALCGACGSHPSAAPTSTVTVTATASPSPTQTNTLTPTPSATPTSAAAICVTRALTMRLGASSGAAGSRYQPIVFTNVSSDTCLMRGYPGVSFVAPATGHQVGAPAVRITQTFGTVTLAPGGQASALLQVVDIAAVPPAGCDAVPVSGLRVYPPGSYAAGYIPFSAASTACSTQVRQLFVRPTVAGSTGQ
jgi:hypothetical protein